MEYGIVLHTPEKNIVICDLKDDLKRNFYPFDISVTHSCKGKYELWEVTVSSEEEREVYISVQGKGDGLFYSFNGPCKEERIFRQSPHAPKNYHFKMEKSAIPMIAVLKTDGFSDIFISDNPSYFENATTQHMIPEEKSFYLSSGDRGGAPNYPESDRFAPIYHKIGNGKTHTFRFIAFHAPVGGLKTLRKEAFLAIEKVWGSGSDSHYRAMCFASNYMHIRKNETGTSEKWVVAGIEYSNTQYFRDAFYQTMILDESMQEQGYLALDYDFTQAENPLVYLIWSYRVWKNGKTVDRRKTDYAYRLVLDGMKKFEPHDAYYPNCREIGTYRCWFDTCAFAHNDIDLYNQGLLVCALESAKRLGYDIGDLKEKALRRFHALFNGKYFPLSKKKQCLALDFTVGEVIHYLLFDELFIDRKMFEQTYRKVCDGDAKTKNGIKIVAAEDGSYLPLEIFGNDGQIDECWTRMDVGRYQNGGSWHLYEMIFHIAAYLHGMPDAEKNLTERLMIDLNYDGATHEYMHTLRGNGVKANQGWNAAIWAIWNELIQKGKATDAFFRAADAKMESIAE